MKKFLLLLTVLLTGLLSASAEEYTLALKASGLTLSSDSKSANGKFADSNTETEFDVTLAKGGNTNALNTTETGHIRVFKDSELTIIAPEGMTMSKLVLTATSSTYGKQVTVNGTKYGTTSGSTTITIDLGAENATNSVTIVASTAQSRYSKVVITATTASTSSVPNPTITAVENETDYTVSIAHEDAEAVVRYTTDNADPTETSTQYTGSFNVAPGTTVKAQAFKGGEKSGIVTYVAPTYYTTLAEIEALANNTPFLLKANLTVVYAGGDDAYITDGKTFMPIYQPSRTLKAGDALKRLEGTRGEYGGMSQITGTGEITVTGSAEVPVAKEGDIELINSGEFTHEYCVLNKVTVAEPATGGGNVMEATATDEAGNSIVLRNKMNVAGLAAGVYNVTGFVGKYNATIQFYPTAIEAYVAPAVKPSEPVVTYVNAEGETVTCTAGNSYDVPYLTELTVTVENAKTISILGVEYQGNQCKFVVKETNAVTITGINDEGSSELMLTFTTTPIDPVLTFDPAEVKLYFDEVFTAPALTAPEELTTFTYASSNTEVAEVDNTGKVTIKAIGENVTITVKSAAVAGKYNEGTASYTINVLDPETRPMVSEFNFAQENPYGLYTFTTGSDYESKRPDGKEPVTSISDGNVTLTFSGDYRAWSSKDLRLSGTASGKIVITPNNPDFELETVTITQGSNKVSTTPALDGESYTFDINTWGEKMIVVSASNKAAYITGIKVTLRKLPEMATPEVDVQGTVLTFKCQHPAYMLQYRIYIPEWDKEQPANGPARVMAEQDWTDNEAGLGQHFTHEVNPDGKYAIEVRQSYNGNVTPVSSYYVAADGNVSGIEDVVIENAPAVYYNLQGVRVEGDLTPGLYIRRSGNTTTKVIVR